METTIVQWLSDFGTAVFFWSLGLFLVVNGIAAVAYFARRDRAQVNRWTTRILAVDLLLIGTGAGVPLATTMAKLTINAFTASFGGSAMSARADDAVELETPGK